MSFFGKTHSGRLRGEIASCTDDGKRQIRSGMKYGRVLRRPFECDYQCKEGFNLSLGLKTVCGFLSSPHDSEFGSFFIKM